MDLVTPDIGLIFGQPYLLLFYILFWQNMRGSQSWSCK